MQISQKMISLKDIVHKISADWLKKKSAEILHTRRIFSGIYSLSINQITVYQNISRRPKSQKSDIIFLGKQRTWMRMFNDVQTKERGKEETQNTRSRSEQQFQMYAITLVIWS